jgi:hypothetical protein
VLLKRTKTAVSSKPIVMRAEYAHCPNLTIIDTPGFVLKVGCLASRWIESSRVFGYVIVSYWCEIFISGKERRTREHAWWNSFNGEVIGQSSPSYSFVPSTE